MPGYVLVLPCPEPFPNVACTGCYTHRDATAEQQRRSASDERKQPHDRCCDSRCRDTHENRNRCFVHCVDVPQFVVREAARLPIANDAGTACNGERSEGADELEHEDLR
jgi:hypothetical protein